jgi:WD40 repeat protein/serine/threonine protein kinase
MLEVRQARNRDDAAEGLIRTVLAPGKIGRCNKLRRRTRTVRLESSLASRPRPMTDLDLSGRRLGEFVLRERIGAGGYGTVYRCEQPALKRDAVVKVLHGRHKRTGTAQERFLRQAAQDRFLREAQLASRLDHPYAAHVYSFGVEQDGLMWIAMELVQGVTLSEWLKTRGPMPLDLFVHFFEAVAQVVQAAHERGIVHRDLKPSNIMVLEPGGRMFPKLLDFGIAKENEELEGSTDDDDGSSEPFRNAAGDDLPTARIRVTPQRVQRTRTDPDQTPRGRLTRPGVVLGSAPYMSPEQWGSPHAVTLATDIYSLGCVAYEALTGRVPFPATNTGEYYDRHLRAVPPSLGIISSPNLDGVLRRALAKVPEDRHGSALELAAELGAAVRAEPRQQLRSAAQQWHDRARPAGLLWGPDVLTDVEQTLPTDRIALTELECSFVAASQRRAQRLQWLRRSVIALAIVGAGSALVYRSNTRARLAEKDARLAEQQARLAEQAARAARALTEARATESELEQGRAALLHGEPEALAHLAEAYKRDHSGTTAFMLARAMQPRLAERARFASTYGRMWWATFSPDGRQIATTDDRAAQIWDGETHALRFTLPHGGEVYQAVYSPDGRWLATVTDTVVRIWDASSGTLIHDLKAKPSKASPPDYYRAAISVDGKVIAAMNAAGSVIDVWNAIDGAFVAELHVRGADFPGLAFSSEGWLAATGGEEVAIFDPGTWKRVAAIPGPVRSLAFGRGRLSTGTATGQVALWAIPSGTRLRQLRQFGESVDAMAISPDGQLLATGSRDGAMQVWRTSSGALYSQLNPRHSKISGLEFDPASKLLLAANQDGTVVVADTAEGLSLATLEGPQNVVRVARFGPDGQVVAASVDGTARVWDAHSPYRRWSSEPMSDGCGVIVRAEAAQRFVAVACGDLATHVWDTASDRLLADLPSATSIKNDGSSESDSSSPALPAVSLGGDRAAVPRGNRVEVYELPGGRLLRTIEHDASVTAVAFAKPGRELVTGAADGSVLVTDDDGSKRALQATASIDAAELVSGGRVIIADAQRRLRVYASTSAVLADLEMPARIASLPHVGERVVAVSSNQGNAAPPLIIDLERLRVLSRLEGHVGHVFSAQWVSDDRVITAGADGTARLWDAGTGALLRTYRGGPRFLADATMTPEGLVIGGDADGLLRFWDATSGAKLWTLQAHKAAVIRVYVDGEDIVTRGFTGEISRWRLPRPELIVAACAYHALCGIVP